MPKIHEQLFVKYSKEQMFHLINDIDNYSKFVPDCVDSKVLLVKDNIIEARLAVEKAGIRKSFTTRNTISNDKTTIAMTLVDGPFQKLDGSWILQEVDNSTTQITIDLDFVFQGHFLDMAFGAVFQSVINNMLQAFSARAKEIYG